MEFIEALQKNAAILAEKATELCKRIETLRAHGHTADATIAELLKTCGEIERLNDAITRELAKAEGTV